MTRPIDVRTGFPHNKVINPPILRPLSTLLRSDNMTLPATIRILSTAMLPLLLALPADAAEPLHKQIDALIKAKADGQRPVGSVAPRSSDAEFVRRVYLDLTGMIPTAKQTRAFLADKSKDKRTKLIDKLLATPEYARQMQRRFDVMLMRRLPHKNVSQAEWQAYLRDSFAKNKPWDAMVREILSADGRDKKLRGAAAFYLDRNGKTDAITRDVGRIFLGADLECAQCHHHPEIDDWKQDHYYGLSAFLVRSYVVKDRKLKKTILGEKAVGEVSFQNVFEIRDQKKSKKKKKGKPKVDKSTVPKVFEMLAPKEPKFKKGQEYVTKPSKTTAGKPKFSRRDLLPKLITSPNNERFARSAVNRLWAMYLGRGIVHPIDRDHSGNPPSHPKLLALLTKEFVAHKYDVKWFIRELMLSETYQRSSRTTSKPTGSAPSDEATFTRTILRPLSPEQLAWSLLQAVGETDIHRKSLGKKLTEAALHKRLASYERRFITLFGGQPGEPPTDFESSVDQVLFLSNDPLIGKLLTPRSGNLADRLNKLPADQPAKIADELFVSVLSRRPTKQDTADITAYLKGQTGAARTKAIQELIWATVTSAEFRFNH